MRFANPAGLALFALAVPVILTHILRPRRSPVVVSSTMLWRRLERPVAAATPWQRLRWSLLLLAQLLGVVGLALAVARPERVEAAPLAEHTVFIVDASGSMAASDGDPDRLSDAVTRATELRDELPTDGLASIVIAGAQPRVALTGSTDEGEFGPALRTIDAYDGHPDFAEAFSIAQSLDNGTTPIGYVLLTDGGLSDAEAALLPPGTRVERVGFDDANRSIGRMLVDRRASGVHVSVAVYNPAGPDTTQDVRVDVDGVTVDSREVELPAGRQTTVEFDVPDGDVVEAFLAGDDRLPADNHAVAVVQATGELRVLLAGDPLFWSELLAAIPGVTVETSDDSVPGEGYDLAIYNGVAVPEHPGTPFIAIAPPGGLPPAADAVGSDVVNVDGTVESPAVTLTRSDDPVLAAIDLSEVAIASAQRLDSPTGDVLVAAEGAPLLVRGQYDGERFMYLAFDLRDSNLPVQLAFPLLGPRLVDAVTNVEQSGLSLTVGDPLPVTPTDADVQVDTPGARVITVSPGDSPPRAVRAGLYTIRQQGRPDVQVAVSRPADESLIAPRAVEAPPGPDRAGEATGERTTSWLAWILWPLLAVVVIETLLARRRVGVGRRQWIVAVAARAVVFGLVAAALFSPRITRAAGRVATVFVVDHSASMGVAGQRQADQFVIDALAARDGSSQGGVVVFGAESRVDQVVSGDPAFGNSTAIVDRSATDIESALRLGRALLPNDAARRIVLVSDGRATSGDVADQVAELRAAGIPVDVVTVANRVGADVAVSRVDVPRAARPGDEITVGVHVESTVATTATVVLRRDGSDVGTRQVELASGDNVVEFTDTPGADAGALMRYEASVQASGDSIAENDTAFGAVAVEGPAKVLVVEGVDGEADTLAAALRSGGIGSDVVSPGNVPGVDELITYAGIVLVDVSADDLSGEQIDAITSAVRELGRGLVTFGGVRSYGVGGYRDSPINDLLPVDSEILDPTRRLSVAEVLSIDTSESMGACHCAAGSGQMGAPDEGGVNKTDISRAAAERTIQALSADDEVGVLAWNSSAEWVIDLQQLPAADVIDEGLRSLHPAGNTNMQASLTEAADALAASDAELKHIILFTDGFTDPSIIEATADQAAELYEESGITVSVLATGEGAAPLLRDIADAGHGRFYAGDDLQDVPQIMAEEAVIASRDFINEGEFFPEVTSDDEVVTGLGESPPLLGYVATSAKGQASVLLRIGPDRDPLLATWQAGLGRVTSWTSDAQTWAKEWTSWDGYVDIMSAIVKDTLPSGDDAGAVQADVVDGRLQLAVESGEPFPDGATATVNVRGPDGQTAEVRLERTDDGRFESTTDAPRAGSYAVNATVVTSDGEVLVQSTTLATSSYPAEYVPGDADTTFLSRLAASTGGRVDPSIGDVWQRTGLTPGSSSTDLRTLMLVVAAGLFALAVVISRLSVRGATWAGAREGLGVVGNRVRAALPSIGGRDPGETAPRRSPPAPVASPEAEPVPAEHGPVTPGPDEQIGPAADARRRPGAPERTVADGDAKQPASSGSTLDDLLSRKRSRRHGGG